MNRIAAPATAATGHDDHDRGPKRRRREGGVISIETDPRLVAAIVDRVTFHAHIIETGSDSYRLKSTIKARHSNR